MFKGPTEFPFNEKGLTSYLSQYSKKCIFDINKFFHNLNLVRKNLESMQIYFLGPYDVGIFVDDKWIDAESELEERFPETDVMKMNFMLFSYFDLERACRQGKLYLQHKLHRNKNEVKNILSNFGRVDWDGSQGKAIIVTLN